MLCPSLFTQADTDMKRSHQAAASPADVVVAAASHCARRAYPIEEARALLGGISRASLYELIQSGELVTVMLAGRRLVPSQSIDELLNAKLALQAGTRPRESAIKRPAAPRPARQSAADTPPIGG